MIKGIISKKMKIINLNMSLLLIPVILLAIISLTTLSSAAEDNVCCEKTKSGLSCQDVTADKCAAGSRQVPSSCQSTSYCRLGYCYDSIVNYDLVFQDHSIYLHILNVHQNLVANQVI